MSNLRFLAAMIIFAALTQQGAAEITNDVFGNGADVELKRLGATVNDGLLRIKNQSGSAENSGNDRVGLIKYDLSGLTQSINFAKVRFQMPRGASNSFPNNTFDAGETLYLYGVPESSASDENFNEATVTFANYPYLTGTGSVTVTRPVADTTGNGVNDTLVSLLGSITFTASTNAGDLIDFESSALTSFLQADTNDIATFLVSVSTSNAAKTAVFTSDTGTEGTPPTPPTLRTNIDVVNTNFDGLNGTDLADFHILRANYLTGTTNAMGDANFDGTVNYRDFFLWRTVYLAGGGSGADFSFDAVPEPATLLLMACTAFGAFGFARPSRQLRR
jgi:hypothetical protein